METATQEAPVTTSDAPATDTPAPETPVLETPPTPKPFDPSSIAPEVKSHFEKQYDGYGKYKELASEYEQLLKTKEFREWYQGMQQPKPEVKQEISDEEFVAALSDKSKFAQLVRAEAERVASEKFGPKLQQVEFQAAFATKKSELDQVVSKYPDFMDLDSRGLIEPYTREGLSFERAYKLAKFDNLNEEVDRRARGLVDSKKAASVEKPGATSGAKSRKVKAKSSLEAMEIAAEAYKAGREAPEIDFE